MSKYTCENCLKGFNQKAHYDVHKNRVTPCKKQCLEELVEEGQTVRGIIIALEEDNRIRRALAVAPNIEFYKYQVNFRLFKS